MEDVLVELINQESNYHNRGPVLRDLKFHDFIESKLGSLTLIKEDYRHQIRRDGMAALVQIDVLMNGLAKISMMIGDKPGVYKYDGYEKQLQSLYEKLISKTCKIGDIDPDLAALNDKVYYQG